MPKRKSVCLDFKNELEKKMSSLPDSLITSALSNHIENRYINGRKPRQALEMAKLTIDHLAAKHEQNKKLKLKVSDFTESLNAIKKLVHEDAPPEQATSDQEMIVVIRTTRIGKTNVIYKYDQGFVSKHVTPSMKGKTFYLSRGVFNAAETTDVPNDAYREDRERHRKLLELCGFAAIDRRISHDHFAWRNVFQHIMDRDMQAHIMDLESRATVIEVIEVRPLAEEPSFQSFKDRVVADSAIESYVDTCFIKFPIKLLEGGGFDLEIPDSGVAVLPERFKKSCFYRAIAGAYKTSFDKYHASLKRQQRRAPVLMTPGLISEVCLEMRWDGESDLTMTVEQASRFFQKYNLGLRIFDPLGKQLYSLMPNTFHSKIRPRVLDVIYKDNHVTRIVDTRHFQQLCDDGGSQGACLLSDTYRFRVQAPTDTTTTIFADTFESMMTKMSSVIHSETNNNTAAFNINVVWVGHGGLNNLLKTMVRKGYSPSVHIKSGVSVSAIMMNNLEYEDKPVRVYIGLCASSVGDEDVFVTDPLVYKMYKELDSKVTSVLIKPDHLSHYNDSTRSLLKEYSVSIPFGSVDEEEDGDVSMHMIDMCKHYASCLASAPHLVSLSPFERFQPVEKWEGLKRERLYLVEVDVDACINPIYKMKDRTLMFYDELADLRQDDVPHRVLAFVNIILHKNDILPGLLKDIFGKAPYSDIPIELRKGLVNRAIGELGRKKNRRRVAVIYKNEDDAKSHCHDLQQKRLAATKHELFDGLWVVKEVHEAELNDGFVPINELIKSMARHMMSRVWKTLSMQPGCKVVAFKTDAVYFMTDTASTLEGVLSHPQLRHILKHDDCDGCDLGRAKYCLDLDNGYPRSPLSTKRTVDYLAMPMGAATTVAPLPPVVELAVAHQHMKHDTLVLGGAGCGKTHTVLTHCMSKYGKNRVLVVTAWNSQAKRVRDDYKGVPGITWHRLRGSRVDDTIRPGSRGFDLSGVSAIVFDEIMLLDHKKIVKLAKFMQAHRPSLDFYATGDPKQLEAVGDVISNERKLEYIHALFPNSFRLEVNVRLRDPLQRDRMARVVQLIERCDDIPGLLAEEFGHAAFITGEQLVGMKRIKRAITYYNRTSMRLNRILHDSNITHSKHKLAKTKVIDGIRYHFGDTLVCRVKTEASNAKKDNQRGKMHVNYRYTIETMSDACFRLKDDDGNLFRVPTASIPGNFTLPYASTVHSSQGDKIEGPYVIADVSSAHITKNWLVSAITRCTDLNDIHFLVSPSQQQQQHVTDGGGDIAEQMVKGYRLQDKKAGRSDTGSFVTKEWILDAFYNRTKGICPHCGHHMTFEKNSRRKVSVNRLDNGLPHIVGNIELCCWDCNNRYQ